MARPGRSDRAALCPQTRPLPPPPPPPFRNFGLKLTVPCVSLSLLDKQCQGPVGGIQGLPQCAPPDMFGEAGGRVVTKFNVYKRLAGYRMSRRSGREKSCWLKAKG